MTVNQSFTACENHNNLSATATAASVTLSAPGIGASQCEVVNDGTNDVFVNFSNSVANGGTGVVACSTSNGYKVLAGSDKIFNKGYNDTIGYVCASAQTATISLAIGEGQ